MNDMNDMNDKELTEESFPRSGRAQSDGTQDPAETSLNLESKDEVRRGPDGGPEDVLASMTMAELWQLFPIQLTQPQLHWAKWFHEEKERLELALSDGVAIHHIGSTAIREIWAKPIIDLLVEAPPEDLETIRQILKELGYREMARSEGRIDFNKGYTPKGFAERVFHLHLRQIGDCDELYFRDHLNRHPELAKDYEALKLALWKEYEFDRDGYTERKTGFVQQATFNGIREQETKNQPIDPRDDEETGN